MDTKALLGRRLRELRKARKFTLEKLAEKSGVGAKYLGGIERGTENPTISTLEKVADALSVGIHQIILFEHQIQGERALRRRIVQILAKCDERELQQILRIVSAMKD